MGSSDKKIMAPAFSAIIITTWLSSKLFERVVDQSSLPEKIKE
jgi:hypothetical protein